MTHTSIMLPLLILAAATGCANDGRAVSSNAPAPYNSYSHSSQYGTVSSVSQIERKAGNGIGAGAVIGGVIGGVLGHQFGQGSGNTAATVAGALGGGYIGDKVQDSRQPSEISYQLVIRMDNGGTQTVIQNDGSFRVGDRVEVSGNQVRRR